MSHLRGLSTKYRAVNLQNNHCAHDLRSELEKLEQQRVHRVRELNHQANQVRRQSFDAAVSEASVPARSSRRASLTTSSLSSSRRPDFAESPKFAEPSPRRKSQGTGSIPATQKKEKNKKEVTQASNTLSVMPQIVVSGHESDPETMVKGENGKVVTSSTSVSLRRGSLNSNGSVGSLNSDSSSVGQGQGQGSQLLDLPYQRSRSNSLPAIATPPQPPKTKRRASYCPEPARHLEEMTSTRDRSSGVLGILSAKRRGSLSEGKDKMADRDRNKAVRRRSIQLDRMLRNLSFGVQCYELDEPEERKGLDPQEWEQLKNCRYLRVPGKDDSD